MNEDYLFDGTGTPDPDVERLEQLLGRLRSKTSAPSINRVDASTRLRSDMWVAPRTDYAGARFLAPALAAAATIALMVGVTWKNLAPAPSAADVSGKASWEV